MWRKSRFANLLVAVTYGLAVSASALFHNHAEHHDDVERPGVAAADHAEEHDCAVCQYQAQKPAPTFAIETPESGSLVQEIIVSSPLDVPACCFSAWHSRAPPPPA